MCLFRIFRKNPPCLDAEEEEASRPQEPAPATTARNLPPEPAVPATMESNLASQPATVTETNLPPKAALITTEKNKDAAKACESDEEYYLTSDSESLPSLLVKCRAFWEKGETNVLTEAAPVTTEKNKNVDKACISDEKYSATSDSESLPNLLVKFRVFWEKGECSKSKENNNENSEEVENNNGGYCGDEEDHERDQFGSK